MMMPNKKPPNKVPRHTDASFFRPGWGSPGRPLGLEDVLAFGKYKGYKIGDVIAHDAQYIEWCVDNIDTFKVTEEVHELFKQNLGNARDALLDDETDPPHYYRDEEN